MTVTFSQFCTASQESREALRQQVERYARQGKSYEFPDCQMPSGCVPARTALGFWRQGDGYFLYWRPAVRYQGQSRVLAALFSRSLWRFESFEALALRLQSLRREVEQTAAPYCPPPITAETAPLLPTFQTVRQPLSPKTAPQRAGSSPWPSLYLDLKKELERAVLGQERAVEATAFRLYGHVGKKNPARPLSLILYGPTGVGKSELGKAVAPVLELCCGRRYQFVWTDLNTFTQPHSVHRLTGAPPGYVGYEDQPIFEAVRRNPYTVFMFDELEKAHPEVLKVFMSILDEGRCTAHRASDSGERELDFRRCVLVFTTNSDLSPEGGLRRLGFGGQSAAPKKVREAAASPEELARRLFQENEEARQAMIRQGVLQEIAGRFSGIIGFSPLDSEARLAITVKQIQSLGKEYGLQILQVEEESANALAPGEEALSVRSAAAVLEGILTPLFAQAAGGCAYRLTGVPGALRLKPAYPAVSSSFTVFAAGSSR